MPPGASLFMRGLGMREIDRHIKNQKRGRRDLDKYDRPKSFSHNQHGGGSYPTPLGAHANGNNEFSPYMTEEDFALLGSRDLDGYNGSLGGLSDDYLWRLFEWERPLLRREGHTTDVRNVRGREARNHLEFEHWLRTHPHRERLEAIRARDHDRGCVGPDNHI